MDPHWRCSSAGWNERQNGSLLQRRGANSDSWPNQGGYRLYHQQVVEELHLIQNLRGLGLPLSTIGSYLAAKRQGACHCEQLKQSMREQQQAIHQKIAALQNLQQELSETMEGWVNCGGRLDAKLM